MKKLFSLLLIVVMLVSLLIIPAAAAEVEPRDAVMPCSECGVTTHIYSRYEARMVDKACAASSIPHWHDDFFQIGYGTCPGCGHNYYFEYLYESQCMIY